MLVPPKTDFKTPASSTSKSEIPAAGEIAPVTMPAIVGAVATKQPAKRALSSAALSMGHTHAPHSHGSCVSEVLGRGVAPDYVPVRVLVRKEPLLAVS